MRIGRARIIVLISAALAISLWLGVSSWGAESIQLPIVQRPLQLTYFVGLNPNVMVSWTDYSQMTCYKELEKRTNIRIKFLHPPVGQENEQFNLMVASGDYPDIIEGDWLSYPGGPEKAIQDRVIIPLNDLIEKHAPNLKRILDSNPEARRQVMTDDGRIYCFPFLRLDPKILVFWGFQVRQDWLDKLGLEPPETLDEWYKVLKAFKERDPNGNGKPDELPFASAGAAGIHTFMNAWGMTFGFYQVDGKVKYGPAQPEYKDYLALMNKWYKEGLIDPDYVATDAKQFDAKMTGNLVGAYTGFVGSGLKRFTDLARERHPGFKLVGVPYPIGPAGKSYNMFTEATRIFPGLGAAISTKNKHVVETVKWLDYHYSDEGHMILNFGVEGISYKLVNGYPRYTEDVTKNPKLSIGQAIAKHARASFSGPMVQDPRYFEQYMAEPVQQAAISAWAKASRERILPPITPTPQESRRFASIMSEINTYVNEMFNKFVMGQESLNNFDQYIRRLKSMGLDEAVKIQQAALDRYMKRR